MFKNLVLSLAVLFTTAAFADHHADGINAKGHIFIKNAKGQIEKNHALMHVPAKGKGQITVTMNGKKAQAFGMVEKEERGRKIVTVVFVDPPGTKEHSVASFHGSLLLGSNVGIFYGDLYLNTAAAGDSEKVAKEVLEGKAKDLGTYVGGFEFRSHHGKKGCEGGSCAGACGGNCGGECGGGCAAGGHQHHQGHGAHHGHQGHHGKGKGHGHQGHHEAKPTKPTTPAPTKPVTPAPVAPAPAPAPAKP